MPPALRLLATRLNTLRHHEGDGHGGGPRYPTAPTHLRGPEADGAGRQPAGSRADPAPARRSGVHGGDLQPPLVPRNHPRAVRRRVGPRGRPDLFVRGGAARHRGRGSERPRLLRVGAVCRNGGRRADRRGHARSRRGPPGPRRPGHAGREARGRHERVRRDRDRRGRGASRAFRRSPIPPSALGPRQLHDLRAEPGGLRLLPRPARGGLRPGRLPSPPRARRAVLRARDRQVLERRRLAARVPAGQPRRGARARGRRARR